MTGRERVTRAIRFERPDRAPRHIWPEPAIGMFRADELALMRSRFPEDFDSPELPIRPARSGRERGEPLRRGSYTDSWGCEFHVAEDGRIGEVRYPMLADWSALDGFEPPWNLVDPVDLSGFDAGCGRTDGFVLAGTDVRPFERVQFLRGTENVFLDLGSGSPELERLLAMIHAFNLREIDLWAGTAADGIYFSDDWGSQQALLVSPGMWRRVFKPLYSEYCRIIHDAGKFVFFHSDGATGAILPDLVEVGVDALNAELYCMDAEEIARVRGRITFWGQFDPPRMLAFGTPDEVRENAVRFRSVLDDGRGGIIASCVWGGDVPAENVVAAFEAWL